MQPALPTRIIPLSTSYQRTKLEQWLTEAIVNQTRLTATYHPSRIFLAAVPLTDVELIAQLKRCLNAEDDGDVSQVEIFPSRKYTTVILQKLFDHVEETKECLTLTYLKKLFIIVVPKEKEELMEEIEDWIDNADADDALREGGSTTLDDLIRELGL